jgi:hypothetical protein
MIKRWYNSSGITQEIGANSGGNYTYWFTDVWHTTHITVAQGLPATGDVVYWDEGTADVNNGGSGTMWQGVTIAGGSVFVANGNFVIDLNCVVAAGVVFNAGPSPGNFISSATWLGVVNVGTSFPFAGIYFVSPSQTAFGDVYLRAATIDLHTMPVITLTGTMALTGYTTLLIPSGTWVILNTAASSAYGVGVSPSLGLPKGFIYGG